MEGEASAESVIGIVCRHDAEVFAKDEICVRHPHPILAGIILQVAEHTEAAGKLNPRVQGKGIALLCRTRSARACHPAL